MRGLFIALACAVAAACAQQSRMGPEEVVRDIYVAAEQRLSRNQTTTEADLPLTEDFSRVLTQASEAAKRRDEPFIDGDVVLDCQECTGLADLSIATTSAPANGNAIVEARFRIAGQDRIVIWDMKETRRGWRVDNIRGANDRDLRADAREAMQP